MKLVVELNVPSEEVFNLLKVALPLLYNTYITESNEVALEPKESLQKEEKEEEDKEITEKHLKRLPKLSVKKEVVVPSKINEEVKLVSRNELLKGGLSKAVKTDKRSKVYHELKNQGLIDKEGIQEEEWWINYESNFEILEEWLNSDHLVLSRFNTENILSSLVMWTALGKEYKNRLLRLRFEDNDESTYRFFIDVEYPIQEYHLHAFMDGSISKGIYRKGISNNLGLGENIQDVTLLDSYTFSFLIDKSFFN